MTETSQPGATCEEVLARLFEHLDGELPPSLDTWVREHLAVCGGCLARTQHQRAFLRAVRNRGPLTAATQELRVRVERALREGGRSEHAD